MGAQEPRSAREFGGGSGEDGGALVELGQSGLVTRRRDGMVVGGQAANGVGDEVSCRVGGVSDAVERRVADVDERVGCAFGPARGQEGGPDEAAVKWPVVAGPALTGVLLAASRLRHMSSAELMNTLFERRC